MLHHHVTPPKQQSRSQAAHAAKPKLRAKLKGVGMSTAGAAAAGTGYDYAVVAANLKREHEQLLLRGSGAVRPVSVLPGGLTVPPSPPPRPSRSDPAAARPSYVVPVPGQILQQHVYAVLPFEHHRLGGGEEDAAVAEASDGDQHSHYEQPLQQPPPPRPSGGLRSSPTSPPATGASSSPVSLVPSSTSSSTDIYSSCSRFVFFHGMLTRADAELLLSVASEGTYLMRRSVRAPEPIVSFVHLGHIQHCRILVNSANQFYVGPVTCCDVS
jgi:hypothetical protein